MGDTVVEQNVGAHDLRGGTVASLDENAGRVPTEVEVLARSADSLTVVSDLSRVDRRAVDELRGRVLKRLEYTR